MPVSHLRKPFDPIQLRRIAGEMELRRRELKAEIVVVRGLSGTLVASAMSTLFETPIAIVRKPDERSHSCHRIEMVEDKLRANDWYEDKIIYQDYIIVDDLIASGTTVDTIIEAVDNKEDCFHGKCVGILLYHNDEKSEDIHYIQGSERSVPVFHIGQVK